MDIFTTDVGQVSVSTISHLPSKLSVRDRVRSLVLARLERSERVLPVLQIGLILTGVFAAGSAQIMPETEQGAMPWREVLGYGGAAFTLQRDPYLDRCGGCLGLAD